MTAAWGVGPADTALLVQTKLAHRPVFSPEFAQLVGRVVPRAAEINAPVILPVSFANGQPAMVELRRTLVFHTGARGIWKNCRASFRRKTRIRRKVSRSV